jgi:hypothetical protein
MFVSHPFKGTFVIIAAQLVEALRNNPKGRAFDSHWRSLDFFIELFHPIALWP